MSAFCLLLRSKIYVNMLIVLNFSWDKKVKLSCERVSLQEIILIPTVPFGPGNHRYLFALTDNAHFPGTPLYVHFRTV